MYIYIYNIYIHIMYLCIPYFITYKAYLHRRGLSNIPDKNILLIFLKIQKYICYS